MRYGRRERGRPRARRASYLRDVRYEVAKDGVGRATEFVGAGIAGIRVVRQRIHRQRRRLHQLLGTLRGTHDAVKVLLRGGRPDLQRHVHANLHAMRDGVAESLALLGLVDDDLRTYQSSR